MNPFPENIRLNGQNTGVHEFIEINHSAGYEKELADFLGEWYGPEDEIEAGTSGSTGTPKTISLTKKMVIQSARRTLGYFGLRAGDRILHCLPLKFIAGKLMVVRALAGNLDLFMTDPGTDFTFLQAEKFRFAAMVPHQVSKILESEPAAGTWLNNIEHVLIGGSAIPRSLEKQLQDVSASCYSSYGMTETATHIAIRKINGKGAGEYYHCLHDITVQKSEDGCLQIFMPGLAAPPLTTTDIAEVRDEKTFRITGRTDNVIISGGIKYSPEQIEKKLEPFIKDAFLVSSLPHESLGQQLVLAVEGRGDKNLAKKYLETCMNLPDNYERPKRILFLPEIPKTGTGKPDRKKLASLLNDADDGDRMSGNAP